MPSRSLRRGSRRIRGSYSESSEDTAGGVPVSHALATIRNTGLSVATDREGRFDELAGVPVGRLELVLRHLA